MAFNLAQNTVDMIRDLSVRLTLQLIAMGQDLCLMVIIKIMVKGSNGEYRYPMEILPQNLSESPFLTTVCSSPIWPRIKS